MKFKRRETIIEAWYYDGKRRSYDDAPDWVKSYSNHRHGVLTLESKSGVVHVSKPFWIIQELDGKGVYPCAVEAFETIYSPI